LISYNTKGLAYRLPQGPNPPFTTPKRKMQKENHKRGKRGQKDENKRRLSDDVFIFSWFCSNPLEE
jgi:hypothetical protein